MKIVIIDDSTTNLIVLRGFCSKLEGADCVGFADSEQAIDFLMANDADLVMVDYSMPRVTGIEVIKRMRASERHGTTPIIMVTSSAEVAVRRRALEVGATEFLTKPVKAPELMARIKGLTAARQTSICAA